MRRIQVFDFVLASELPCTEGQDVQTLTGEFILSHASKSRFQKKSSSNYTEEEEVDGDEQSYEWAEVLQASKGHVHLR